MYVIFACVHLLLLILQLRNMNITLNFWGGSSMKDYLPILNISFKWMKIMRGWGQSCENITNMETDQIFKFVGYDHYYDKAVMSKTVLSI